MFREMRVGALDLNKAFAAYELAAAACPIQIGWVVHQAQRAFFAILVQKDFQGLPVHKGITRQVDLSRGNIWLGVIP